MVLGPGEDDKRSSTELPYANDLIYFSGSPFIWANEAEAEACGHFGYGPYGSYKNIFGHCRNC